MKIKLRAMSKEDWPQVVQIYTEGIATGNATFQQDVPTYLEWDNNHLKNCRIVALVENEVVGWAALSPVSGRCVYAGVAEVSVYVSGNFRGHNIGEQLLKQLITASEKEKLWTLEAGIFPENLASSKLHKKLGFRTVGYREKIGQLNGVWRNVILLEKRSELVGVS
ncbi:N-acetyltransferase family protein [Aureibaculum sp. 2210JD6-5]|uniref:GNAT family N-acetyltransferase n=1 Tax=Aureibaculum sp. 2210JD6-5 TaxID=3103957 RepID=UPI002AAD5EFA|nr:N-acetyltransferase family protein [Aureibaculum sp. 2210JD6-5]MDY7393847.1 N-acetyltransferase family protein [Aureibaculum sp. 2210JD6-5]